MANTVISLKSSGTSNSAPANLAYGELALNYADGKLFYKSSNGSILSIKNAPPETPSFGTINVAGAHVVAGSPGSILNLVAGTNILIDTDIVNDVITISASGEIAATDQYARDLAGLVFNKANSANVTAYYSSINANAAFASSNLAKTWASAAYDQANAAYAAANTEPDYVVANAAFNQANTGTTWASAAFNQANSAYDQANTAESLAIAAYDAANQAYLIAGTEPDYIVANAAFAQANSAYNKANSALANTTGTFAGTLTLTGNLVSQSKVSVGQTDLQTIIYTSSNTNEQTIDLIPDTFRTAHYIVSMNAATNYQTTQLSIIHDDATAYLSEYGTIFTGLGYLGTFTVNYDNGNIKLNVSPTNAVTTIKLFRTSISR